MMEGQRKQGFPYSEFYSSVTARKEIAQERLRLQRDVNIMKRSRSTVLREQRGRAMVAV